MKTTFIYTCFRVVCLSFLMFMSSFAVSAQGRITIKTNKKVNESINVKIKANGAVTVTGATGAFKNGATVSYKLTAQEVSFEGDFVQFENQMGRLTQINFEKTNSLEEVVVWINELTQLDLSACPNLTYINVMSNKLTELNLSGNSKLTSVNCAQNKIESLLLTSCKDLVSLDCGNNLLTTLDLSKNPKLGLLNCSFNKLRSLDVSQQQALQNLNCSGNQIESINLLNNKQLQVLSCFLNKIPTIDFSNNGSLLIVDCGLNPIGNIDLKPLKKATIVDVSGCKLTSVDVSENSDLKRLNCHKNKLTALSVANNKKIRRLSCYGNNIKGAEMTRLMKSLRNLDNEPIDVRQAEGEVVVIDTKDPDEKNVCTRSDVAIAQDLFWLVKDFNGKHAARVDYGGSEDEIPTTDCIAFSHGRAVGGKIQMKIVAEGPVTIKGASGTWKNNEEVTYIVDMPRIVISGKVTEFVCSAGDLTSIDLSTCPSLVSVDLSLNKLTKIDVSKNVELQRIKCEYNLIETLDFSCNPKLTKVWCYATSLKSIEVANCPLLDLLSCNDCKIAKLDLSNNKKLTKLSCSGNPLGVLDLSNNTNLEVLWCAKTEIKTIDLSKLSQLTQILCQQNFLTSIDLSKNPKLTLVWASNNELSEIDFSHNPQIIEAFFYDNRIEPSQMNSLIASLPQRLASDNAAIFVINTNSSTEKNVCSVEQVEAAKKKNYKVYAVLNADATEKEEYPGSTGNELIDWKAPVLYPNPASDFLMLNGFSPSTVVRLLDATGRCLLEEEVPDTGTLKIELKTVPAGTYLLVAECCVYQVVVNH